MIWTIKNIGSASSLGKTSKASALDAVERAKIHNTTLVIKENGKIKELSPAQMKQRLMKDK